MVNPVERKRVKVEVTEEDIAKAHRNDSYKCVVAQAIARIVPDATRIEVDTQTIRFTSKGARLVYLTPYAVQGYVVAFDAGEEIEPFDFNLREPMPVRRRVKTEEGKAALRAATKARTETKKAVCPAPSDAPLEHTVPTVIEHTEADAKAAYREAWAEARQANPGATEKSTGGRKPTPRVFKTKQRSYGHRILRINQAPAE